MLWSIFLLYSLRECVCECVCVRTCVCVCVLCPSVVSTLCDPVDCRPSVSSVHGIFQARILKWVAISYSGDLWDPGIKPMSLAGLILAGGFFTIVPPRKPTLRVYRCIKGARLSICSGKKLAEKSSSCYHILCCWLPTGTRDRRSGPAQQCSWRTSSAGSGSVGHRSSVPRVVRVKWCRHTTERNSLQSVWTLVL